MMTMYDITKVWVPENLSEIFDKHIEWVENRDKGERADLSYADLRSFEDVFAKYEYAPLKFINFKYADLESLSFRPNMDMTHSDFEFAKLDRSILTGADLRYSNFHKASLQHVNLHMAGLERCNFKNTDLYGVVGNGREIQSFSISGMVFTYTSDELQIGHIGREPFDYWRDFIYGDLDHWFRDWLKEKMPIVEMFLETMPAKKRWLPVNHEDISEVWKSIIENMPIEGDRHDMYAYFPLKEDMDTDASPWRVPL